MGIEVAWDDKLDNVVLYDFSLPWTWNEFQQAFNQELALAEEIGDDRYDVIADFRNALTLPAGAGITHVASAFRRYPPNWGSTVVISSSMMIVTMVRLFNKIYPATSHRFVVVTLPEQARRHIRQSRGTIDDDTRPTRPNSPVRPKNGE
jgi:hypothetical protein